MDMIAFNVTNLHAQSNSNDSLTSPGQLKGNIFILWFFNLMNLHVVK